MPPCASAASPRSTASRPRPALTSGRRPERLRLTFPLLADPHRAFAMAARLPVFEAGGQVLLRRLTLVIDDGVVSQVFYPVFPADRGAQQVIDWLDGGA